MRNLTLGVLIVSGGTIAALPFRRLGPRQLPESHVRATGPIDSPLQCDFTRPPIILPAATTVQKAETSPPSGFKAGSLPVASHTLKRRPDLGPMEPLPEFKINTPPSIADRFNATVVHRQNDSKFLANRSQLEPAEPTTFQPWGLTPTHSPNSSQVPAELSLTAIRLPEEGVSESKYGAANPVVPSLNGEPALPLPEPKLERPRHWIRQPD